MLPFLFRRPNHLAHLGHPFGKSFALLDFFSLAEMRRKTVPVQFQTIHVITVAHLTNQCHHVVTDRFLPIIQASI